MFSSIYNTGRQSRRGWTTGCVYLEFRKDIWTSELGQITIMRICLSTNSGENGDPDQVQGSFHSDSPLKQQTN